MKQIDSILHRYITSGNTPSIQYALFDNEKLIHSYLEGYSQVHTKAPISPNSTYNLFSITKTLTAIAVLRLAQVGLLQINDPVVHYLPQLPFDRRITVLQLLNHTSGIQNPIPIRWAHLMAEHAGFNQQDFNSEVFKNFSQLKSNPGERCRYSNIGYLVLGELIEHMSGQKFERYIADNIFVPAGIQPEELSFTIDPKLHATGYQKQWSLTNGLLGFLLDKHRFMGQSIEGWKPFNHFYINGNSYGGMIGSGIGLMKYAQALLASPCALLDDEHKELLFKETSIKGKPTGMSFSWFTGSLKGSPFYTHAGGGGGYYSEIRIYPGEGVGSILLLNRSGLNDARMLDELDIHFLNATQKNLTR